MPDGQIKHVHIVGHPVFDETGDFVEFVGTVMDVTERRRAEEERQAHRARQSHHDHGAADGLDRP